MVAARLCGAALALLLLATGAAAWPGKTDNSIEAQLARWVIGKGGRLVRWDGQLGLVDAQPCLLAPREPRLERQKMQELIFQSRVCALLS